MVVSADAVADCGDAMSVKAMSLVWDLECPKQYGDITFKSGHKFILMAYADHADHQGRNIFPAVPTIARKCGVEDRTVQRITSDLEQIGLLVDDGFGPRGTNKWKLPFSAGGDKLSPATICRGDKSQNSLGDIPSGDIPSGDKLTPEFKEPEPETYINEEVSEQKYWDSVLGQLQSEMHRMPFETWLKDTKVIRFDGANLVVGARNSATREWLDSRVKTTAERLLIGIMNRSVKVSFVVSENLL